MNYNIRKLLFLYQPFTNATWKSNLILYTISLTFFAKYPISPIFPSSRLPPSQITRSCHDTTTSPLFMTFLTCILSWLLLQSEDLSYVVYSIFPLAIPLSVVVSFLRHTSHKFRFTNHVNVWFPKFRRTSQRKTTCCVIYSSKEFAKSCQLGVQWWGWTCKEQKFRWIWCHVIGVDLFGAQNSCGPGITWWGLTLSNKSLCGPE
jgi:hypothetical protein